MPSQLTKTTQKEYKVTFTETRLMTFTGYIRAESFQNAYDKIMDNTNDCRSEINTTISDTDLDDMLVIKSIQES